MLFFKNIVHLKLRVKIFFLFLIGLIGEGAGWSIREYNAHKYAETTQVSKIIEMRGWCKGNLIRIL